MPLTTIFGIAILGALVLIVAIILLVHFHAINIITKPNKLIKKRNKLTAKKESALASGNNVKAAKIEVKLKKITK